MARAGAAPSRVPARRAPDRCVRGRPPEVRQHLALLLEKRFEGPRAPGTHARDGEIARPSARPDPRLFRNEEPLYPVATSLDAYLDELLSKGCIRFIGLACNDDDIERAVELGSFENMRNEEQHGAEPYLVDVRNETQREPTYGVTGERDYSMRRGQVDSWRDEMSTGQLARIEHEFARAMAAAGYLPAVT
jgi:Sulfotransferase domain